MRALNWYDHGDSVYAEALPVATVQTLRIDTNLSTGYIFRSILRLADNQINQIKSRLFQTTTSIANAKVKIK